MRSLVRPAVRAPRYGRASTCVRATRPRTAQPRSGNRTGGGTCAPAGGRPLLRALSLGGRVLAVDRAVEYLRRADEDAARHRGRVVSATCQPSASLAVPPRRGAARG